MNVKYFDYICKIRNFMKNLIIIFSFVSINLYAQKDSVYYNQAKQLYFDQEYVKAIKAFEWYLQIEKDNDIVADIYHYIGISYYMLGDHDMAIKNITKNLEIHEKLGDKEGAGNAYNNLGAIYDVQKNYDQALSFYNRSLSISKDLKDTISIAASLNNIASVKINLNRNYEAILDLRQAIRINKRYNQTYPLILNYRNVGNAYSNLNRLDTALYYHERSLELAISLNDMTAVSASYENIGEDYLKMGRHWRAVQNLKNAYIISSDLGITYYTQVACKNLSQAYEELGRDDSALYFYKLYNDSKDSVFSKENQEYTSYLEIKYKTKEKENEILQMQHEDLLKNEKILNQEKTNRFLITILSISFFGAVIIIILLRKTKKALKENVKIGSILKEKNKDITDSIKYAKNIQAGMISTPEKFKKNIPNSFVLFKPKDIVSGDFYWSLKKDGVQYFAAADCTGHGVPGAMMSIIGHTGLTRAVHENGLIQPNEILDKLNVQVSNTFDSDQKIKDGMDISLCRIDKMKLSCSMANNAIYIVRSKSKKKLNYQSIEQNKKFLYKIEPDKQYIGCGKVYEFTNHEIDLETGDMIYIFSDGFADQFGGLRAKKYKYSSFQEFLIKISDYSEDEQSGLLKKEFEDWKGFNEQTDDVLVIGVKI